MSGGIGPDAAAASGIADEYALGDGPQRGAAKAPAGPENTLAYRLEKLAEANGLAALADRDAFRPSEAWLSEFAGTGRPQNPGPGRAAKAISFGRSHTLKAVLCGPDGASAIVDDRCMTIGQKLAGCELIAINDRSVVFEADGVRVTLRLAPPSAGSSR